MRCPCTALLEPDAVFCGVCGRYVSTRRRSLIGLVMDGRFAIDAKIAAGGFATIYRATHVATGCPVALKVLHAEFATDRSLAERFRREAAALGTLRDPHTVTTYELGEAADGTLYIAMELLRGDSLLARFHAIGPLPWRQVVKTAGAVCSSLAEAHALGIVHRDIKPANIHLEERDGDPDFVKVVDFGVAKVPHDGTMDDGTELTRVGEAVGTIDYMAPEQLIGGDCDARTDIYALGVVMYEMLTGRRPFADAIDPTVLMAAQLMRTPEPPSTVIAGVCGEAFPSELDRVVLRCLQRDSRHRYQDVRELAAALDRVLAGPLAAPERTRALYSRPARTGGVGVDSSGASHLLGGGVSLSAHPTVTRGGLGPEVELAVAWRPERALEPMPPFQVNVIGTEVNDPPPRAPGLGVVKIASWGVALLAAGLGIGALVAILC